MCGMTGDDFSVSSQISLIFTFNILLIDKKSCLEVKKTSK